MNEKEIIVISYIKISLHNHSLLHFITKFRLIVLLETGVFRSFLFMDFIGRET